MLFTIHNLPANTRYQDVKNLLRSKCGLTEIILDKLVIEGSGKRVTIGLADEGDAASLMEIDGFYLLGNKLFIENLGKKKSIFGYGEQQMQDPLHVWDSPMSQNEPSVFRSGGNNMGNQSQPNECLGSGPRGNSFENQWPIQNEGGRWDVQETGGNSNYHQSDFSERGVSENRFRGNRENFDGGRWRGSPPRGREFNVRDNGPWENNNHERPTFDDERPTFDRERPKYNQERSTFDRDRSTFDCDRSTFDRERPTFDYERPTFDHERPTFDNENTRFDHERPKFDSERPKFDYERPKYDCEIPVFYRERSMFDRERPTFDGGRPSYNHERPSYERSFYDHEGDMCRRSPGRYNQTDRFAETNFGRNQNQFCDQPDRFGSEFGRKNHPINPWQGGREPLANSFDGNRNVSNDGYLNNWGGFDEPPQPQQRFVVWSGNNDQIPAQNRPRFESDYNGPSQWHTVSARQPNHPFNAFPETGLESNILNTRTQGWINRTVAKIAQEMTGNVKLDVDVNLFTRELKKTLRERILGIFSNEKSMSLADIMTKYRQKYPKKSDKSLFNKVLERVTNLDANTKKNLNRKVEKAANSAVKNQTRQNNEPKQSEEKDEISDAGWIESGKINEQDLEDY